MVTCGMTPILMAFPELQTTEITYLDNAMNIVFGIDIILNFFTAYYDEDFIIVDDNKVILFLKLKNTENRYWLPQILVHWRYHLCHTFRGDLRVWEP